MWVLKTSPWVGTAKQGRIHRNALPLQARRGAAAAVGGPPDVLLPTRHQCSLVTFNFGLCVGRGQQGAKGLSQPFTAPRPSQGLDKHRDSTGVCLLPDTLEETFPWFNTPC